MKACVHRASTPLDDDGNETLGTEMEIKTLEDLLGLMALYGHDLVLFRPSHLKPKDRPCPRCRRKKLGIIIYDTYIE